MRASVREVKRWASQWERGATAVEYGLLVALIAGVIFAVVALIGPALVPGFETVINSLP